ncbi:MAG: YitT family protein [Oscillospiraceae bacterium]|nr:YitT family protein [Oscillospiraceae bacterium]
MNTRKKISTYIYQYVLIAIGSIIYAVSVSLFLDPNEIVPGGFTGIAMIIGYFIPSVQTGTVVLILNIPILAIGIWKFGAKFLSSTVFAVVLSSVAMNLLEPLGPLTEDPLLCCVAGGCLMAIGLQLVMMQGATTGGTDIIVKLLSKKFTAISGGSLFLMVDGAVVLLAIITTGNIDKGLYAALCIIISSVVTNLILNGTNEAKLLIVISDFSEKITSRLMEELDVGVTLLEGHGAYSQNAKRVIICVVKKSVISKALKIVKAEDDRSFTIVTTANEVFGEGYKLHGGDNWAS